MKNVRISSKAVMTFIAAFAVSVIMAKTNVTELRCEYHTNPIGIDVVQPRLSWKMANSALNAAQSAYEIRVASTVSDLKKGKNLLWHTAKVASDQSLGVVYEGPQLSSGQGAYWQVRIWDQNGKASAWSEVAYWESGLLKTADWKADWITMAQDKWENTSLPVQYYRNDFEINKKVATARVYVSSLGLYQLFINGKKVGDQLFTPGFTSYHKRVQYQVYDVTTMLQEQNAIGAMLGDGWYRGRLGWEGGIALYGRQLALIAQLEIIYTDGTKETIITDDNWKTSYGAIQYSDIYDGEYYDARQEPKGWNTSGFTSNAWAKATVLDHSKEILHASNGLPVKANEEIKPIEIIKTPKGETVLDLGQNIVGWARLKMQGDAGHKVMLQFAEVLDKDGNFYTTNLRSAKATDHYILSGEGEEVFEPHFTFHGFRYVKIENYPGELTLDKLTGVVIHSAMQASGDFTCSDSLINQLQKNIQWGQRDNFLDIPTDCPQRDERVGWTGDAQVFSMTAAFNFDVASFYTKWLKDLALDQHKNGLVPSIIPDMWGKLGGSTGWADAAVIIPWTVYKSYGDVRILEEQYASMKAWVEYVRQQAGEDYLWKERHFHWGDWLSYHSDKPNYPGAHTEKDLIATAYYKYSTDILSKAARVLGKDKEAGDYEKLSANIKEAFYYEYMSASGRLVSHTQTAYALALSFGLVPDELIDKTAAYFAADIRLHKHLTTGFLGTPLLCSTLSAHGYDDLAFMLLNRKEYPGWLYPVTQGATTIWERWDTMKPDGSIIEGMNSFNHYAYGAIGEWLYNYVAGIAIDEKHPGYKHFFLAPHPGGGLTNAKAEINTVYGLASSAWELDGKEMTCKVTIPANTSATLILPQSAGITAKVCSLPQSKKGYNENYSSDDEELRFKLGAGTYQVTYTMK